MNRMEINDMFLDIEKGNLSSIKKSLRISYVLIFINFSIMILNLYILYSSSQPTWLTGVAIGVTFFSSLFTYMNMWETRIDYKFQKDKIAYLEKKKPY